MWLYNMCSTAQKQCLQERGLFCLQTSIPLFASATLCLSGTVPCFLLKHITTKHTNILYAHKLY